MSAKKKRHSKSKLSSAQAVSREEMAAILERTRAVLSLGLPPLWWTGSILNLSASLG